jgi:hypothetical protein
VRSLPAAGAASGAHPKYVTENCKNFTEEKGQVLMARILAVGSSRWTNQRAALAALRKVMTLYREPYVLVCDMGDGAPRFAAAAARSLGWTVEPYELDQSKCADSCPAPEGHRRPGGPTGSWCPSARSRNTELMLNGGVDLCIGFVRPGSRDDQGFKQGQAQARRRDIGVWTIEQRKAAGDGDQAG